MTKLEYLLACLVEEAAEVQKEACKALRFGLDDKHPKYGPASQRIESEMIDMLAVMDLLEEHGLTRTLEDEAFGEAFKAAKDRKIAKMKYSEEHGIVT